MKKFVFLLPFFLLLTLAGCQKEQSLISEGSEPSFSGSSAGMEDALDSFNDLQALFVRMHQAGVLPDAQMAVLTPGMRRLLTAIQNEDVRTAYRLLDDLSFTVRRMLNGGMLTQAQAQEIGQLLEAIRIELN